MHDNRQRLAERYQREPAANRALFTNPKNSLGRRMPSLAYRIVETTISPLGKDITISRIDWEEAVDITADQVLAEASSSAKRRPRDAVTFLLTILANGPVLKRIIEAAGGALWSKPWGDFVRHASSFTGPFPKVTLAWKRGSNG
jgi:hypothetical protein